MAISAEVISRAISDRPIQPLFNTIAQQSLRAGVPVIVTNTENNLRVTARATVGSVKAGTTISDEMFASNKSTLEVEGFKIETNEYFTLLTLDEVIDQIPNEMRTDAAGLSSEALMEILVTIGNAISTQIMTDYFTNLPTALQALVPAANIKTGTAGKIEWDPTVKTPADGKQSIVSILDDFIAAFPKPMLPGGSASTIVTAWISEGNFLTMKNSVVQSYQPTPNGGVTSNFFQYVKHESTLQETRNMFANEFLRYGNIVIVPWNGLAADSLIVTYQEGLDNARVFYSKVPEGTRNNLWMVIKGNFRSSSEIEVPIAEDMQVAAFDIPYQVGNQLTINKVENAISDYKVIGRFASGTLLRENDKVFAALPITPASSGDSGTETPAA